MKSDFDAVIFDMDGVIFDSERCSMKCWLELRSEYSDRFDMSNLEQVYLACTGTTDSKTKEIVLNAYGQKFPYDEYSGKASVMFHEKYDGGRLPMKPGVKELLSFLKNSGKKIALASSTRRQTVTAQLTAAGVIDYFDVLVCGDMVKKSKPAPDIYLTACEQLGVNPERAYAIEDSYNGMRSASTGKLMAIMVPDLLPADEEMKSISVAVLDSLLAVIDYLKAD